MATDDDGRVMRGRMCRPLTWHEYRTKSDHLGHRGGRKRRGHIWAPAEYPCAAWVIPLGERRFVLVRYDAARKEYFSIIQRMGET